MQRIRAEKYETKEYPYLVIISSNNIGNNKYFIIPQRRIGKTNSIMKIYDDE